MIGHVPVLLDKVLEFLDVQPGGTYIDATVGFGGHSRALLDRLQGVGRLIGIDQDPDALEASAKVLDSPNVRLLRGNFEDIKALVNATGTSEVDGILMDLGVSSHQLLSPDRGFGFMAPTPLDMRMNASSGVTAAELVNRMPEKDLADLIYRFGEERRSRAIARAIVRSRPIRTCHDLATLIASVVGRKERIHPATRTFQALRIAVNREMDVLGAGLLEAFSLLKPGGRLCVISYHSLEDRIVKEKFRILRREGHNVLTPKPVRPDPGECRDNPRARSAKLRVVERVPTNLLSTNMH